MHEDGRVESYDVAVEQHHALPPILLDIVFQLYAVLSVIVDSGQAIIDFTAGEDEAVLFAVAHYLLENIFLCHKLT